jgi:uncharacterized membrane protein
MEEYIIGLIVFLFLDVLWIYLNSNMYLTNIENIQKSKFKLNIYVALITYLILCLYFIFLIYNKFSLLNCVLISFFTYSIYNFTNLTAFENYSVSLAIIDTLWGPFVTFITMYIVYNYKKIFSQ